MLLSLLTIITVLISGISFAATMSAWSRNSKKSIQLSVFPSKQVSLLSLLFFIFFPTASTPFDPKLDRS